MKRIIALVLVLILCIPSALALELSEKGVLPLTTEDVTLTIGICANALTTDYENNYLTQYLEEKTGVKLDFFLFPSDSTEAKQKLSLMVAGGEKLPDIIYLSLSDAERFNYGRDGYFIALNDYLENDTYYWSLALDQWASAKQKEDAIKYAKSPDGNIYAYPEYYCDPADASALYMSVNKTWLDRLGLEVPTTTEELYNVLKAFKEQDANGNGDPNDEIPLIGHSKWMGDVNTYLMNAFIYDAFSSDFGYQLTSENGQLSAPFIQEAWREGLKYINKLVSEGLLSTVSYSQTDADLKAIMQLPADQISTVGVMVGHPSPIFGSENTHVLEYVGIPSLTGPEGVNYAPFATQLATYKAFITADCACPELAFRFLDACAETTTSLTIRFGEQDKNWAYTTEGVSRYSPIGDEFKVVYEQYSTTDNPAPWTTENNVIWHEHCFQMLPPYLYGSSAFTPYDSQYQEYKLGELCYNTFPARYNLHPEEMPIKILFNEDETDRINDIQNSIQTYVNEATVRFALGQLDVDKDWGAYLNELNAMGLDEYMAISQAAYDRMNGK